MKVREWCALFLVWTKSNQDLLSEQVGDHDGSLVILDKEWSDLRMGRVLGEEEEGPVSCPLEGPKSG